MSRVESINAMPSHPIADLRFVIAAFLVCGTLSAQTTPAPLVTTIEAPKSCVKSGSPIELNITLTNTSDHDVSYRVVATGWWSGWEGISVHDSTGRLLPEKGSPHGGSVFFAKLSLGAAKSIHSKVDVAKEYDLNKPGRYTIEVWPLTEERFKSGNVNVCVTE